MAKEPKKEFEWICPKCSLSCSPNWIACRDCGRYKDSSDVVREVKKKVVEKEVAKTEVIKPEIPPPEPPPKKEAAEEVVKINEDIPIAGVVAGRWECEGCGSEHAGNATECSCCGIEAPEAVLKAVADERQRVNKHRHLPEHRSVNALQNNEPHTSDNREEKEQEQEDEEEEEDFLVTCDICKLEYGASVLEDHIQGHFAFELTRKYAEFSSSSEDAELALKLQQEELSRHLVEMSNLAKDRALSIKIAGRDKRDQQHPYNNSRVSRSPKSPKPRYAEIPNKTLMSFVSTSVIPEYNYLYGSPRLDQVKTGSEEYILAVTHLMNTLTGRNVTSIVDICSLHRVYNKQVWDAFYSTTKGNRYTMMFHGCRSRANENSIIQNGFLVKKCVSGGSNFGTWFAYNSSYSDSGYAFREKGIAHLFISIVGNHNIKLNNPTMKVVGQDAAYPMYLITYKRRQ